LLTSSVRDDLIDGSRALIFVAGLCGGGVFVSASGCNGRRNVPFSLSCQTPDEVEALTPEEELLYAISSHLLATVDFD
jgi:hypothetical protein